MTATVTQFRKDLFQLADKALSGEQVAFTYRGVVFRVIPQVKTSKLANLTGQSVIAENTDLESSGKELLANMEAEWHKDWNQF